MTFKFNAKAYSPVVPAQAGRAALLTIDIQNVFCRFTDSRILGWILRDQRDINRAVARTGLLLDEVRRQQDENLPIMHVRSFVRLKTDFDFYRLMPDARDIQIFKRQSSAFNDDEDGFPAKSSGIEEILQENSVDKLVLTGFWLDMCVKKTAESALRRDFKVAVLHDCTAPYDYSEQKSSFLTLRKKGAEIISASEALDYMRS